MYIEIIFLDEINTKIPTKDIKIKKKNSGLTIFKSFRQLYEIQLIIIVPLITNILKKRVYKSLLSKLLKELVPESTTYAVKKLSFKRI